MLLVACDGGSSAPAPSPTIVDACGANPAPYIASLAPADFGFRELAAPRPGATLRSPLTVSGRANPFEGAYAVAILDAGGATIATADFMKDNRALAFSAMLPFSVTAETAACVWVHERSGRDGSPTNVTQVPVQLVP